MRHLCPLLKKLNHCARFSKRFAHSIGLFVNLPSGQRLEIQSLARVICMVMRTPCQKVIGALVLPWLSFHRSMLSASTQCPNYGIRSNDVTATTDRTRVGWKWFLVSMLRVTKKLTHCFWERLWHGCFIWSLPTKSLASTVGSPTRASPHDELYFFPVPAARVECFLRYSAAAQQASW